MTNYNPDLIYRKYQEGNVDRNTTLNLLESIVDNCLVQEIRVKCVQCMEKIAMSDDKKIFFILENLLLSDNNTAVRIASARALKSIFSFRAIKSLDWLIHNETNYDILVESILLLSELHQEDARGSLFATLMLKCEKEYESRELQNQFLNYQKAIKKLVKESNIKNIDTADILVNYITIEALVDKFSIVRYELEDAFVIELDLSEIRWNMTLWVHQDPKFIKCISEILGLSNLKHLKSLNISNNQVTDLNGLENLNNLIKLNIANNKIEPIEDIKVLKNLKDLRSLNLSGNDVVELLDEGVFGDIEVIKNYQFI